MTLQATSRAPEAATGGPVLRLTGITKRFGALTANDGISLSLDRGEVLALLGENGAGKSTLVSILFGHYVPDEGTVEAFGAPLPPGDPAAALFAGIGMVHQHFTLADNLSVLDNVMLGTEPLWRLRSHRREARERLLATAKRFGLEVDPSARVGTLSVGQRQRVEILKALYRDARVLILDEPTAVLTPQESESLFATLKELVGEGLSIIFISHKLPEVLRVSDRIAVLRGGKLVATVRAHESDREELALLMVGREVSRPVARPHTTGGAVCVVRNASVEGVLHDVSLTVHAGEIAAIAGVSGNGQQVLADVLCGLRAVDSGLVTVAGRALPANPRDWIAARVARIPEDRHAVGVIGDLPLWENALAEHYRTRFSRGGVIRRSAARAFAREIVERFDVRAGGGIETQARSLSGGNMQKLILGRALAGDAKGSTAGAGGAARTPSPGSTATTGSAAENAPVFIVASQPTWGLDIGAVAFVHQQLLDACARGAAVLLISDDLDEIFALADRVAVMHAGRLSEARPAAQWNLATIGMAMAGAHADHAHAA